LQKDYSNKVTIGSTGHYNTSSITLQIANGTLYSIHLFEM